MSELKNSWIAASVTDATIVNPNGTKMLLANTVNIVFINSEETLVNGDKTTE